MPSRQVPVDDGRDGVHRLSGRLVLPHRRERANRMRSGQLSRYGGRDGADRLHRLPGRLGVLDGLDGSLAVLAGLVHRDHRAGDMRELHRWRVSGDFWLDGVSGVHGRQLLPSRRVGSAAVRRWQLLEQPQP